MNDDRALRSAPTEETEESTVRRVRFERSAPSRFELTVLEGPDRGLTVPIEASARPLLLGASAVCAVRLADASVEARHCSIDATGGRLRLVNLGREGATRVNGVATSEAFLLGGELLRLGDTVLAVRRVERRAAGDATTSFGRLLGESPAMRDVHRRLGALVASVAPLLLAGERGVGKRLVAEELHRLGPGLDPGRARALVVLDRARPAEALADALFGGLLADPSIGLVYVEEVAELAADAQARLAEVLRDGRDGDGPRVVLATREEAALAPPLADLLAGARCHLAPLRERRGDVGVLARAFWSELGGEGALPDDFVARFVEHRWPGNVRELRAAVHDRIRHAADETSPLAARPRAAREDTLGRVVESGMTFVVARDAVMAEFERRYVERALERGGGNVARAAAASGIAHRYFQVLKSRQARRRAR